MSYAKTQDKKITSFTDLRTWQEGHALVVEIYKMVKTFPAEERYALGDQLRRSAVSVTSNVAEGFGRQGAKERIRFYYMAQGSLTELKNQLLVARDVGYVDKETFSRLAEQANTVHRLLQGLITSTKKMNIRNS
jgi:four helix bundle protein